MIIRLFCLLVVAVPVLGQTYEVRNYQGGSASAVCVGVMCDKDKTNPRWMFLTNRHLFRNSRTLRVWVGAEDGEWHEGQDVRLSNKQSDVASFTVKTGDYTKIRILEGVPNGTQAIVCGYTQGRKDFCFSGIIHGDKVLANGLHVLPGDSGGPVMVRGKEEVFLAGLIYGYGVKDRNTWFATTTELCDHIQTSYGCSPQCVPWSRSQCPLPKPGGYRYERIDPQFLSPPRVERYEFVPESQSEILEPPEESPSEVEIQEMISRAVTQWLEDNAAKIRGPPGQDQDLGEIKSRLSALEIRKRTLVLQEAGKEIDRQDYRIDQPIILDLQRFIRNK